MSPPTLRPLGDDDVLVECGSPSAVVALAHGLAASPPAWLLETVPAARTLRLRLARNAPRGADLAACLD
ncbi:hypothetical protein GB864_10660, partial [Agromyces sp. MMS17-SY077]